MDIKELIDTTGIKSKEIRFLKPPGYPYIIFNDEQSVRGSDNKKSIVIDHVTSIELYTKEINQDDSSVKIENLILDELETNYKRTREWIEEESHYLTIYDLEFTEKKRR
ncbi:hypothetical protein [Faecalimicrobium sp. JNUCC 81]